MLSLLYIEAKCRFFSVVTWKDIIKYLQNCEGCPRFCEILCIYIYIYRYMHKVCIRGTFMSMPDISAWIRGHHLQLNLVKTELLVFPTTPTLQHDFTIQIDWAKITPSSSVRNLGVIFDDQLTFKNHIAKKRSILQVCIAQHQKDQALPYTARCTTSCPGPCHF